MAETAQDKRTTTMARPPSGPASAMPEQTWEMWGVRTITMDIIALFKTYNAAVDYRLVRDGSKSPWQIVRMMVRIP